MPGGPGRQHSGGALGAGRAGMNAVDGDAVRPQVDGQGFGHVDHSHIAGAAAEIAGVAGIAAADVDDAPPALFLEQGNGGPGAAQSPHILHIKIAEQGILVHFLNVAHGIGRAAGQGSAVDHNVQAAQLFRRRRHDPVHLVGLGNIQLHRSYGPADGVGNFLSRGGQLLHRTGRDDQIATLLGQYPGDGLANAPAAAGHQSFLAGQSKIHLPTSLFVGIPFCSGLFILQQVQDERGIGRYRTESLLRPRPRQVLETPGGVMPHRRVSADKRRLVPSRPYCGRCRDGSGPRWFPDPNPRAPG